jgi:transcriptional regulator with XRE-family HTH domain
MAKKPAVNLLQLHQLHLGLYARVAEKLRVNPSYVSRVANGKRQNEEITAALLNELRKLKRSAIAARS